MEVLACPHCERMFHATPGILGKAIRCRACRKAFRVPLEPSSADLGAEPAADQPDMHVAVECLVHGLDARKCPNCHRTFAMNSKYVGKCIRCRGCRVPFVVLASTLLADGAEPVKCTVEPTPSEGATPVHAATEEPEQEIAEGASPLIHEDCGDLLAAEEAGQSLRAAVRPRPHWRNQLKYEPIRGPFRSGRF